MVKVEQTSFYRAYIGSRLSSVLGEWLVHHADLGSPTDSDTDQVGDVLEITICESFTPIDWVNPNRYVLRVIFIFEIAWRQID